MSFFTLILALGKCGCLGEGLDESEEILGII